MRRNALRKQITMLVPVADWRVMRDEAARRGVAVTELCRDTLEPLLNQLRSASADVANPEIRDPDDNPRPRSPKNRPDHPWRGDL